VVLLVSMVAFLSAPIVSLKYLGPEGVGRDRLRDRIIPRLGQGTALTFSVTRWPAAA
jgi:hypothetical protein